MIVAKIGGSCLQTREDLATIVRIVKEFNDKLVLVVSAFRGVTDELTIQASNAVGGRFDLQKIATFHRELINDLGKSGKAEAENNIRTLLMDIQTILQEIDRAGRMTSERKDQVLSCGEKLASKIVASYLKESSVAARTLWDKEAGIVTDSNFGNATILKASVPLIRKRLKTDFVPVVAGFFGRDENGKVTTFGRGGSDYTATFLGAAMACDVVLFKDVRGIMTADPKIVESAFLIEKISYLDAIEMARYGSKVIFEKAIIPAMDAHIPVIIAKFGLSPITGTTIGDQGVAIGVSTLSSVVRFRFFKCDLAPSLWLKCRIALCDNSVFSFIAGTSARDFSFIVKENESEVAQSIISAMLESIQISAEKGLGLVTVVGNKLRKQPISYVSKRLSEKGIMARDITINPRSLFVLTDKKDVVKTTQALHDLFINSKEF